MGEYADLEIEREQREHTRKVLSDEALERKRAKRRAKRKRNKANRKAREQEAQALSDDADVEMFGFVRDWK